MTNYEQQYGTIEQAADTLAYRLCKVVLDASPTPTGNMENMSTMYIESQVSLVKAVLDPLREWSLKFLQADVDNNDTN